MKNFIVLGILQGIFEWVPISSEGIVALASRFLIKEFNPVDMALFLHLGTLFAVLVYFRKDWKDVLTLKNKELVSFLIISTIVSLAVGYPAYKLVKELIKDVTIGNNLLLITGLGLVFTSYFQKTKKTLKIDFNKLAVITGFLQGLAAIPGFSRSGSTIFGLSLADISVEKALKFSYMMSAPVVLGSSILIFFENPNLVFNFWPCLIFSFFTGILSLNFLINISQKIDFSRIAFIFAIFCFLGALIGLLN